MFTAICKACLACGNRRKCAGHADVQFLDGTLHFAFHLQYCAFDSVLDCVRLVPSVVVETVVIALSDGFDDKVACVGHFGGCHTSNLAGTEVEYRDKVVFH